MRSKDIVVAGGGIMGLSASLAMAQTGCSVAVIEKSSLANQSQSQHVGRVFVLTQPSARFLDRIGVWKDVMHLSFPVRDILIGDRVPRQKDEGHPLVFGGADAGSGPLATVISESNLKQALLQRVMQTREIELLSATRIADQSEEGAAVALELLDGSSLAARLLLGCDGRNSATAQRAAISMTERDCGQTACVFTLHHAEANSARARQYLLHTGPLSILPVRAHVSSVMWALPPQEADRLKALSDAELKGALRALEGAAFGDFELQGPRHFFPLCSAVAQAFVAPRLALMGDAAHMFHPVTGQGLNYGFRDIMELSRLVACAKSAGKDIGAAQLLARYQRHRKTDAQMMRLVTDALISTFSNDRALVGSLRHLGMRALGSAPIMRRFLIGQANGQRLQKRLLAEDMRA